MSLVTLYIRYKGWAVVRIPTDPDPSDEPNGASGYTFAFAGEPRLDRIFRLQPAPEYVRPGPDLNGQPWPWGVTVFDAEVEHADGTLEKRPEMIGAKVDMLGHPKLENRNWVLTYPGWEPFVPYTLQIQGPGFCLQRSEPLSTDGTPYWKLPTETLITIAARGANIERETVGTATGIWDPMSLYRDRKAWLEAAMKTEKDPVKQQALASRLYEVELGLSRGASDNRIGAHYAVERFDFDVTGNDATASGTLPAKVDLSAPWSSSFFFACFDADLLGCYLQGVLEVPFVTGD